MPPITDKNFNFPAMALKPDGTVVPIPINPSNGALRIEVISATGTITPPVGNEVAKTDKNFIPVTMVETPSGEVVMLRMGPDTKRLRVEFN